MENIPKMIHCGDPSFGGVLYCCGECGRTKFVPFRCHSRFCPTCGALYSVKRTTAMSFKLIRFRRLKILKFPKILQLSEIFFNFCTNLICTSNFFRRRFCIRCCKNNMYIAFNIPHNTRINRNIVGYIITVPSSNISNHFLCSAHSARCLLVSSDI